MATALKPQIKTVDMSEEMTTHAIEVATFAIGEYMVEKEMANHIKKEFDKAYRCLAAAGPAHSPSRAPMHGRRCCSRSPGTLARAAAARHGTW